MPSATSHSSNTPYVALLRGINVGGNNKISMPKLKTAFERQGFSHVLTYINSGNVVFNTGMEDEREIKAVCEKLIAAEFGLSIPVAIVSAAEWVDAVNHAPVWWNKNPASKHNAIFVIPPATTAELCAQVENSKPEYEQIASHGKVVFWSAPLATFSRTRLSKLVHSKAMYHCMTVRNAKTTLKLAELVGG